MELFKSFELHALEDATFRKIKKLQAIYIVHFSGGESIFISSTRNASRTFLLLLSKLKNGKFRLKNIQNDFLYSEFIPYFSIRYLGSAKEYEWLSNEIAKAYPSNSKFKVIRRFDLVERRPRRMYNYEHSEFEVQVEVFNNLKLAGYNVRGEYNFYSEQTKSHHRFDVAILGDNGELKLVIEVKRKNGGESQLYRYSKSTGVPVILISGMEEAKNCVEQVRHYLSSTQ